MRGSANFSVDSRERERERERESEREREREIPNNLMATLPYPHGQGFHRAFAEIFEMMRANREARDASDRESKLRQMSLLEHSPRKLEKIKKGLEEIEVTERSYKFHRYRYRALEEAMRASDTKTMNVTKSYDGEEDDPEDEDNEEEERSRMETVKLGDGGDGGKLKKGLFKLK